MDTSLPLTPQNAKFVCSPVRSTHIENQFRTYTTKSGKPYETLNDLCEEYKNIVGFELSSNIHMYYVFDNHIHSFSSMTT